MGYFDDDRDDSSLTVLRCARFSLRNTHRRTAIVHSRQRLYIYMYITTATGELFDRVSCPKMCVVITQFSHPSRTEQCFFSVSTMVPRYIILLRLAAGHRIHTRILLFIILYIIIRLGTKIRLTPAMVAIIVDVFLCVFYVNNII